MEIVVGKKIDIEYISLLENELYKTPWKKSDYKELIDKPFFKLFVLKDNDEIVGYSVLLAFNEDMSDIGKISIAKKYQGNGYSKLLMDATIEEAKKNKCKNIFLEVRVSNEVARKLYLSYGFKEISVRKNYYGTEDGITMVKELS